MDVEHVIILTMENRSFDEYFGTFPGANGFNNSPRSAFDGFWVPSPGGWTDSPVLPYRLSTYSSQQGQAPKCNHSAPAQQAFFAEGAMNGWSLPLYIGSPPEAWGNPPGCMGYYAADDIPYHWWLAENFALCDNYFCSVLGPTWPNRDYLLTGKIENQQQYLGYPSQYTSAPSWPTYAQTLTDNGITWRVYSAAGAAPPGGYMTDQTDLNAFDTFTAWWSERSPGTFVADDFLFSKFVADASNGNLPTVSWLFPWEGFSEHPNYTAADGAYLISQVVEAVLGPDYWASTVLIVNYDENDGHFDHVPPPQPPSPSEYPEEFVSGSSIGAGFRVPCLIISPWTLGRGVCSDPYDHTSVLRFLGDITGARCPNIGPWRLATFGSLSSASASGFSWPGAPVSDVPPRPDAWALRQNAMHRYNVAPWGAGAGCWVPKVAAGTLVPVPQPWPPCPQACQVDVMLPIFGQDQVNQQPGASFGDALTVTVSGFEPAELTTPYAGYLAARRFGLPTGSGLRTIKALSPPNRMCSTRVPDVAITDSGGNPVAIEAACQYVNLDPGSLVNQTPSGVPGTFIFTYSLTFTDPEAIFAGGDQMLSALATFQVDITVTDQVEFEVAVSPAEYCAGLAASIVLRHERGGPPVTKAQKTTFLAQLTACRDQKQLTQQQYEQAVQYLQELNLTGQPPGLPGGGVNPPP